MGPPSAAGPALSRQIGKRDPHRQCPDGVGLQTGQGAGLLIDTEGGHITCFEAGHVQEMPCRIEAEGARDRFDFGPAGGGQGAGVLIDGERGDGVVTPVGNV